MQTSGLSILYTASLGGQIALLPRLFTQIKRERTALADAGRVVLLVDLGQSCRAGAWVCDATGGRAMLAAMDAMGYDAFHLGALDMLYTQPALVSQLKQVVVTRFAAGPWLVDVQRAGLRIRLVNAEYLDKAPQAAGDAPDTPDLMVGLRLAAETRITTQHTAAGRVLWLQGAAESQPVLGRVDVTLLPEPPFIDGSTHQRLNIETTLAPEPTMSGVIEFVQSEARSAQMRRGDRD